MNVNIKVSLTDDERNTMFRRLTGKNTKGMVSRADVNNWVKEQLERFLTVGSPTTERVEATPEIEPLNMDDVNIDDVMKRNELLQQRVNVLQHKLDTKR